MTAIATPWPSPPEPAWQHVPVPVLLVGTNREVLGCNPAAAVLLEQQSSALAGVPIDRILEARGRQRASSLIESAIEGRTASDLDARFVVTRPDGSTRAVDARFGTFTSGGLLIALTDRSEVLTDEKEIAPNEQGWRRLHESNELFLKAFHAAPAGMVVTDALTARYVEVNENYELISGYTREELIGHSAIDLGIWANADERAGVVSSLKMHGSLRDFQTPGRRRDGKIVPCLVSAELSEINGRSCIIWAVRDLSQQLQTEQALRESEEKFASAFHGSPSGVALMDFASDRFLVVNDSFARVFGIPRDDVPGRTPEELSLWLEPEHYRSVLSEIHAQGTVQAVELQARSVAGEALHVSFGAKLIQLGGRPCLVCAVEDITARRRAEREREQAQAQLRQAQKLEALGTLAGGIAHDFNNILGAVTAYLELIRLDAAEADRVRRHADEVARAVLRAKDLVKQILTFSRFQKQQRSSVELGAVARETLELLRPVLPERVALNLDIDSSTPQILADATQLHQVIVNLTMNALQALRDDRGQLSLSISPVELLPNVAQDFPVPAGLAPGRYAKLSVSDSGQGMSNEVLARIFEPFFTTKAPGRGTGLGLAVLHGIVKDHEGAVSVESVVGLGTTFHVLFPEALVSASQRPTGETTPLMGKERILLVDDERALLESISEFLRRLGYQVSVSADPEQALAQFSANPGAFDAVVCDLTMPQLSGVELARQLLRLRPGLPILILSGFSGAWTPEAVRSLGVADLLVKPTPPALLVERLRRAFAASPASPSS